MKLLRIQSLHLAISAVLAGVFLSAGSGIAFAQNNTVEDEDFVLEEVMVTARKMKENIQEVPVAITAIGADEIDRLNMTSLADISKVTPGLIFESEFGRGANRPVIRGQANILGSSGVSYFIDGVYITGSIDDYDIQDVQRMEVVKGPQSALYGRNTYSGAINIITKSPGDEFSGRGKVDITSDEAYEISGTVRGPLTDTLGGGITARYYKSNGPFTNTWDDSDIGEQESSSVSGVLMFTPNEQLEIRGRAYYAHTKDGQPPIFATTTADNNCYFDNGSLYQGQGRYYCGVIKPGPINTDWPLQAPDARDERDVLQTSLSIDYEFNDAWSLTSITGYNNLDGTGITDGDYLPTDFQVANFTPNGFPYAGFEDGPPWLYGYAGTMVDFTFASGTDAHDLSEELRLAYTGDRFTAMMGGYYFDGTTTISDIREMPPGGQDQANANFFAEFARLAALCQANFFCEGSSMAPFFGPTIVVPRNVNEVKIRNWALFGMLNYNITDAVGLTVEARYASEKVTQSTITQNLGAPVTGTSKDSATFDSFNPRVTLDWQITGENMVYLLYAEGNKPGGFNSVVAIQAGLPTYDEEEVKSIEFGSKNLFLDGQMITNFAAYYNQITGYQLTQNARAGASTTSATVNAGDADVYGFEVSVVLQPETAPGFTITTNWAYNKSEFVNGSTDENMGLLNDVADDGLVNCSTGDQFPDVEGCTSVYGSIDGNRIPRSAKNQYYLDFDYRRPFASGNGWSWFVGANYFYEGSKFAQVMNLAETGSTELVTARAGIYNDRWNFQLYGRNLTGEDTAAAILRYAQPSGFTRNFAAAQRRDTYVGLTATMNF